MLIRGYLDIFIKRGGGVLDKREKGNILGLVALLPIIINIVIFFLLRGPDADISVIITIYSVLSIIGIALAIRSWLLSRRLILLMTGLLGNVFVLGIASLLLLAMGIGEK